MKNNSRTSLILFYSLSILLPWLIWGTTIAEQKGLLAFHVPQSLAFWVGLTVAAYLGAWVSGGLPAIKDLLFRLIRVRVNVLWYLVALLFTGVLAAVAIGIYKLLGGTIAIGTLIPANKLLPTLAFQIFFFLITEETAWRGFALPRLQKKFSALNSSLILGLFWGFWHLPLFFIVGSFQSTLPFVGFILSAVATSILITWVFNNSRGSVLLAAIFHASTDVTIAFTNVMSGDRFLFWVFVAVQWIAALILILTQGHEHLSHKTDLEETVFPQSN
jgi:membrane protease YdiL (CAAX protease family)